MIYDTVRNSPKLFSHPYYISLLCTYTHVYFTHGIYKKNLFPLVMWYQSHHPDPSTQTLVDNPSRLALLLRLAGTIIFILVPTPTSTRSDDHLV